MFLSTLEELLIKKANKKEILSRLTKDYNISEAEVHKRVRSFFGKSLSDLLFPSREHTVRCMIQSGTKDEFKNLLSYDGNMARVFEKYFGVSNYTKARFHCETYRENTKYVPSRDDNLSILISQHIGDGHLNVARGALDIQHSEKQRDYLIEKVKLLNKGFPMTQGVGSIKKYLHKQGHTYYRYWSGSMGNPLFYRVLNTPKHELIPQMTPLGMFLLYMDDGCLKTGINVITIAIECCKTRDALVTFLDSYGIYAKSSDSSSGVRIGSVDEVCKFLNTFVRPFREYIPESMKYKCSLMI